MRGFSKEATCYLRTRKIVFYVKVVQRRIECLYPDESAGNLLSFVSRLWLESLTLMDARALVRRDMVFFSASLACT